MDDSARRIVGNWQSDVRDTRERGPMRFRFVFSADGRLEASALPAVDSDAQPMYLAGEYRVSGNELQSDAINEGQAVTVSWSADELLLTFDANLTFRLRHKFWSRSN